MSDTMQISAGRIHQVGAPAANGASIPMTVVFSGYHGVIFAASNVDELEPMMMGQFGRMLAAADLADDGCVTDITDLSDEEYLARLLG